MSKLAHALSRLSPEQRSHLERRLEEKRTQATPAASIPRRGREDLAPTSFLQEQLWLADRLQRGGSLYNLPLGLRMQGPLDVAALESALAEIVRRHEALRTTFREVDGRPVQLIAPPGPPPLPRLDLTALPGEARSAELARLIAREARSPFVLECGPLLRLRLIHLAPAEHAFLLNVHHIAADDGSIEVFAAELGALYAAFATGRPASLPDLPIQYGDFAEWQRRRLEKDAIERQIPYWRQRFASLPPVLELSPDHPRPALRSFRGATHLVSPPDRLLPPLRALARGEGATMFMVLLASWKAFLRIATGQEDVLVASPAAHRSRPETEGVIGPFVNLLALRTDVSGDPSFRELLGRVRETVLGAFSHQDLPFEKLVEILNPPRDPSRPVLAQVGFSFRIAAAGEMRLPSLRLAPLGSDIGTSKLDLGLFLTETGERLQGHLEYSTDLYEAGTMERLGRRWVALLEEISAQPGRRLSELTALPPEEYHRVLLELGRTAAGPIEGVTLGELFSARARRSPGVPALCTDERTITYAELNAAANRLAHRLLSLGVGPETPVGLYLETSAELVLGLLAALKAGGAYLPLDPSSPREHLALLLEDARVPVLLTRAELLTLLPRHEATVICIDGGFDCGWDEESTDDLPNRNTPENLAYLLYTSGSTGRPKGVGCTHRAVVNVLVELAERRELAEGAGCAWWTSLTFDVATSEIFSAFAAGGTLYPVPDRVRLDGLRFFDWLAERNIQWAYIPPFLLADMAERLENEPGGLSLVRLLVGVEPIPETLLSRIVELLPGLTLINGYGPTEATIATTFLNIALGSSRQQPAPIGRPARNTRAYLLDRDFRPVPVGVTGELFLGGICLARGYLYQPSWTASRFIPDPFADPDGGGGEPGARLYRTGDLARWQPTGHIEFMGRVDHQVKIRGIRVELGEIEVTLEHHPELRDAAVLVLQGEDGEKRLVAYVVPRREGQVPAPSELRRFLGERLTRAMAVSSFVPLPALPLTPGGKVDRRALAEVAPPAVEVVGEAPRTWLQEVTAEIFAEVLGCERVALHEDFFSLGGHSLLATRVVSRIREACGVELPLIGFFAAPTVAGVAEAVQRARRAGQEPPPPIVPVPRDGELSLSFAQQRLWFLDQLQPGGSVYNIPFGVLLTGDLQVEAFAVALQEVVRRHEALRTSFPGVAGSPVQRIAPPAPLPLPLVDLAELPPTARDAESRRLAADEAARSFDLAQGSLLRIILVRRCPDEHLALAAVHHIVADAWSVGILVREVAALYRAGLAGEPSPLPDLQIQYADFALWQRRWLSGPVLAGQLAWWREHLAGSPPVLALPWDRRRPQVRSTGGEVRSLALPEDGIQGLRAFARSEGATLFMVLLTGFAAQLARYSGQDDVVVGSDVAGRNRLELEGLIGFFVNMLVLRTRLERDPAFRTALGRVREAALGAYDHQDIPFEKLVEDLQPARDLGYTPLFQVVFGLQNAPAEELRLPALRVEPLPLPSGTSKFDLSLSVAETGRGLAASLTYSTDLFDAATADRVLAHFAALLAGATADPEAPLSRLPLLSGPERRQLLEWAGPESAPGPRPEACLHELFQMRARLAPDSVALVCGGEHLTYGELDARAARLVRRLRALRIGPEARVGVCLDRSLETVVAILGVLSAGGAYVPLDPAYPTERLALLLDDSRVPVVVTHRRWAVSLAGSDRLSLCLDESGDLDDRPEVPASGALPENLAYVIYTSGSTGRPKGVEVTHANAVRLFSATAQAFGFGEPDVWTLFHSYAFDFSVWEIWGALLHGGRLVIVPWDVSRSPERFHELLVEEQVTVLSQTPSAFFSLMQAETAGLVHGELALRWIVFGGEALDLARLAPWYRRHPEDRPRLVNMYGITETTVHVTCRPLSAGDMAAPPGGLLGPPISDLWLHVLDRGLVPCPVGVPGELFVGGTGVARGYLGAPDLTASRFMPDPFGEPGGRLYRSGDLARRRSDGDLEYIGRADHQIKVRGFRIEPAEIEAALGTHPQVQAAVVLARSRAGRDPFLAAYVVPSGDPGPTIEDLERWARERLPEHMVPAAFMLLRELPLTGHGKVDRAALPDPGSARPELEQAFLPPESPQERLLAEIWQEVLGLDRVGAQDSFFTLGGDSIRSIRVLYLGRERGLHLSLQQIFQHQTLRALARAATASSGGEADGGGAAFALLAAADREEIARREDLEDAYPLSQLQAGMLFHSETAQESAVYHDIFTFHLRVPELSPEAFAQAVRRCTARHPVLRTSFDLSGFSEPLQLVHRTVEVPLETADLRALAPAEQERAVASWIEAEKARAFDWSRPPLLRFQLHRRSEDRWQLSLAFHHAILDGWSVATLLTELFAEHGSTLRGEAGDASPETVPFRDFIALEREALASSREESFWDELLAGAERLDLPRWPHAPRPSGSGARSLAVPILPELSHRLLELAAAEGLPIKSLLLAAHAAVLRLLGGAPDVLTGLVANGRPEVKGGDRALGLFLNTIPFRLRLDGGTWRDLARAAFAAETALLPHRRYPLAALVRRRRDRLFDVAFNFVHFHVYQGLSGRPDLQVLAQSGFEETNFALTAVAGLDPAGEGVLMRLAHDAGRLTERQAQVIAGYYARALEAMAWRPDHPLLPASLLSAAERHQILSEWNDAAAEMPDAPVQQLIARRAARTPAAIAVDHPAGSLTCRELDERSSQVARRLRELGAGCEEIVGVCLERSPDLIVAFLAVLKAGAAYLPLDPVHPAERRAWMLAEAGATLLVTDARNAQLLARPGLRVLRLDVDREEIERQETGALLEDPDLRHPAYVIYTSGSTGAPKGVLVSHGGLTNLVLAQIEAFGIGPQSRVLQLSSPGFDASVSEVFTALVAGAVLCLPDAGPTPAGEALAGLLSARRISVATVPPSLLASLDEIALPDLATLVVAGEACPPALAARWSAGRRLLNAYGPTEVTVCATLAAGPTGDPLPIGRPLANQCVYLLGTQLDPVPLGTAGEICVAGSGVARGYLGRPDLTAERFAPGPFGPAGSRLYRTGDLARQRPDGAIEFLGRIDRQVKVRGVRVEPGEVEAALAAHPGVREAAVDLREAPGGERRLVAWIAIAAVDAPPVWADLREHLERRLPEPMIPSIAIFLDGLPRTASGKLDRAALPAPESPASRPPYEPPASPVEEELAAIWVELLGVDRVGRRDDFFELGGHSLLATRLIARVRRAFQIDLPLSALFETRNLADLAARIWSRRIETDGEALVTAALAQLDDLSDEEVRALLALEGAAPEEVGL